MPFVCLSSVEASPFSSSFAFKTIINDKHTYNIFFSLFDSYPPRVCDESTGYLCNMRDYFLCTRATAHSLVLWSPDQIHRFLNLDNEHWLYDVCFCFCFKIAFALVHNYFYFAYFFSLRFSVNLFSRHKLFVQNHLMIQEHENSKHCFRFPALFFLKLIKRNRK